MAVMVLRPIALPAQDQQTMNRQAERSFQTADGALNKVYQRLLGKMDAPAQTKLKAAQRAWVQFRDAEASFATDLDARDGSMAPLIYEGTRARLTQARTKELQRVLDDYKG